MIKYKGTVTKQKFDESTIKYLYWDNILGYSIFKQPSTSIPDHEGNVIEHFAAEKKNAIEYVLLGYKGVQDMANMKFEITRYMSQNPQRFN